MAYDFKKLEKEILEVRERLSREFNSVRTGRASSSILDGIEVELYGTRMKISQMASVSVEDARTLRIVPFDVSQGKEIEKAITAANLGLSVGADERGVRVFFPELTHERRESLIKIAKSKLEDARTALRAVRDEVWSDIQGKERAGTMSEDDKFRNKDDMQKRIDTANKELEIVFTRKEKEIKG